MHGAHMALQVLLAPAFIPALTTRNWLLFVMAKHMSLQCPFSFEFGAAFLTYMVVVGMCFAHVQVVSAYRLEFRTAEDTLERMDLQM